MRRSFFILALSLVPCMLLAQQIDNIFAELDGDQVRITYDLSSSSTSELFEVELYASHNNFSEPLQMVSGDVGKNIETGEDKIIIWRPKEELENFTGEIIFEVRATLLAGYYQVSNPTSQSKYKKKKVVSIRWRGGERGENVKIEVIRSGNSVMPIAENIQNSGSYNWIIPKRISNGSGYQVRISNLKNPNFIGISKAFKIAGGIPTWALVGVPVVLGGAVAGVLMSGGNEPGGGTTISDGETSNNLPVPPDGPIQ